MIKKQVLALIMAALFLPISSKAQSQPDEDYPADMLAALDSLTILLNQNCTKANAEKCFDPSEDEANQTDLKLNPKEVQQLLSEMESGIPLDYNNHVKGFIDLYAVKKRQLTERILTLSEYYFPMFEEILDREGLPQEFKYLAVVESALNPQAKSWAGACGLWQFIHSTGEAYGLNINGMVDERHDPEKATLAACQYFKNSYALYGDWLLVIASYNCGPGNVNKAIRRSGGKRNFWKIMQYLPRETRGYVPAFIAVAYVMNNAEKLGLKPAQFDVHSMVQDIELKQWVHFGQLQQALGIPMEDLEYLNPEYRKQIVPATNNSVHQITLPYKYAQRFAEIEDSVYAVPFTNFTDEEPAEYVSKRKVHKVRSGETLARIARKYNVKISDLKAWNIIRGNSVRPGKNLVVYTRVKKKISPTGVEEEVEEIEEDETPLNINQEAIAKTTAKDSAAKNTIAAADSAKTNNSEAIAKTDAKKKDNKAVASIKTPRYHKVQAGDTLYSISKKYPGLTIEKLRDYNRLAKNAVIKPGTKLIISPGG